MTSIIIAVLCGFVGGMLGSMIIYETRDSDAKKQTQSLIDGHLSLKSEIGKERERINLISKAVRIMASDQERDRTWIMQSLNDLWIDYDQRHKEDAPKKTEKPKKAKKEMNKDDK